MVCVIYVLSGDEVYMAANGAMSRMCDSTLYLQYYEKNTLFMRKFMLTKLHALHTTLPAYLFFSYFGSNGRFSSIFCYLTYE